MRRILALARSAATQPGITALRKGLEATAIEGTSMELPAMIP